MISRFYGCVLVLVAILFAAAGSAGAATYYIDGANAGASDSNPGTAASPWKTITKANNTLVAGDTVYIKAGTYSQYVSPVNSGTANARITYQNYGSDTVTISGTSVAIRLIGKSYITVQGLTFYHLNSMLDLETASHNTFAYCNFVGNPGVWTGNWTGSLITMNSTYNWVHHCTFSDWGLYTTDDIGAIINVGDEESQTDQSNYNLFENNTMYHAGHHVFGIFGRFNVVRNNYFHNENWSSGYGDRVLYLAGYNSSSSMNLIEGNRISGAGDPPDNSSADGIYLTTRTNIVRFNAIYGSSGSGIMMGATGIYYTDPQYNHVYNNTLYKNGQTTSPNSGNESKDGIGLANWGFPDPIIGNAIKNNLCYANPAAINTYRVNLSDQVMAGNFLQTGDPKFVDISSAINVNNANYPNFQLQTGSPCIDSGAFLTTITSAAGSGTTFQVADPYYFMDGWGIIQGDQIQLQGSTVKARITSINYGTRTISVDTTLTWTQNQGIALAYSGAAPDAGAYESGSGGTSTNLPPSVAAIPTRTIAFPGNSVALSGVATDPNKDALTFTWAQISGPAQASFSSATTSNTVATVSARGTYVFRFTASDGQSSTSADSTNTFSPDPSTIVLQAEAGTIAAPFTTSGTYISQSGLTGVTDGGRAAYTFSVPQSGNYIVTGIVNAPDDSANSFFVNIDGEPTDPVMVWDVPLTSGFESRAVSWRGTTALESPKVFPLAAGSHTLIVRGREGGVQLDRLEVSPTTSGGTRPSAPANLRVISVN